MSASNWAVCPRCLRRATVAHDKQVVTVMATYGTVTVEEFDQARAAIEPVRDADYATFREDYEIHGAETGTVKVGYAGECDTCGLSLDFHDKHEIPGASDTPEQETPCASPSTPPTS